MPLIMEDGINVDDLFGESTSLELGLPPGTTTSTKGLAHCPPRGLHGRVGELEGEKRGLAAEVRHLKTALEEGQAALSQQRKLASDLQCTVDDQRADIRAALDLVSIAKKVH